MLIQKPGRIILIILILLALQGCSSIVYKAAYPTLNDGKYDSEFPYKGSSKELEDVGRSVTLINSIAFYKAYIFNDGTNVKRSDISEEFLENKSNSTSYFNKINSGTATTVYSQGGTIALLTCAHVVNFPDTILTFFSDESGKFTKYLESVSIRERQVTFVPELSSGGQVEILALDRERDLAIIGNNFPGLNSIKRTVFPFPKGKAKDLEWGSFVYVFGYPMNYKMVSKAIVSNPNYDEKGGFIIDAVVNKGFSGGVVLAIRDGIPNFELVGIIRAIPEENEYLLEPEKLKNNIYYSPVVPYKGNIYAVQQEQLKYGIAKVIPIEEIMEFINNKEYELKKLGYRIKDNF
ncbi:MAG TPA: serine protease [Ignavibacteriaceae bacterium]|nr:serine protease [Ignavibacteriaceae bacterium]